MTCTLSRRNVLCLSLSTSVVLLSGCATSRSQPVPGSFAWFDLISNDLDASRTFYSELFGWRFGQAQSDGYIPIRGNGEALGGMISAADAGEGVQFPSQWVPIISVADVQSTRAAAIAQGGAEIREPFATQDGTFATLRDSRGALFLVFDGSGGFPLDGPSKLNTWQWADLITDHSQRSKTFYANVFGFDAEQLNEQIVFKSDGVLRGGLVEVKRSKIEPNWLPYVGVADVAEAVALSRRLGGGPLVVSDDAAVLLDPTGAAIGVAQLEGQET